MGKKVKGMVHDDKTGKPVIVTESAKKGNLDYEGTTKKSWGLGVIKDSVNTFRSGR